MGQSCAWALKVTDEARERLDEEQRRGLAFAVEIAKSARRRRQTVRSGALAFPKHRPSEGDDGLHFDRDGDYFFDYAQAKRASWCPRCRWHSEPEQEAPGVWFRPRECPLIGCDGYEFPKKRKKRIPPKVTVGSLARRHKVPATEIERLIDAARQAVFPGMSDRTIRRKTSVSKRKKPTKCAECGKALPRDRRPQSDRVGAPRRYCAACSTPAARVRRHRRLVATS